MTRTERSLGLKFSLLVGMAFWAAAGTANAGLVFECVLDGPTAGTGSSAVGYATLALNDSLTEAEYIITYAGLEGNEIASHFHYGDTGAIGPRLLTLPPGSPKTGVWLLDPEGLALLLEGRVYINVHTSVYPSGEIRGDLAPTTVADQVDSFGAVKALFR